METIITDPSSFFFPRSSQAELYADGLQRGGIVNLSSGLFLAAPAGTGKTTFLTRDLMPELARRDVIAIYVDLSDSGTEPKRDPIVDAIAAAIRESYGGRQPPFDLDAVGHSGGATLASALTALVEHTDRQIALIVDEAEIACRSAAGTDTLFALKAARDSFIGGKRRRQLVFAGSDRRQLGFMVNGYREPFLGASLFDLPLLDRDFTDALCAWMNRQRPSANQLKPEILWTQFEQCGYQPRGVIGSNALKTVRLPVGDAL